MECPQELPSAVREPEQIKTTQRAMAHVERRSEGILNGPSECLFRIEKRDVSEIPYFERHAGLAKNDLDRTASRPPKYRSQDGVSCDQEGPCTFESMRIEHTLERP